MKASKITASQLAVIRKIAEAMVAKDAVTAERLIMSLPQGVRIAMKDELVQMLREKAARTPR